MFLNHLYGGMDEPELKIIDVFICKLRKKLAAATGGKHYIETVWGRGYVLREPNEAEERIRPDQADRVHNALAEPRRRRRVSSVPPTTCRTDFCTPPTSPRHPRRPAEQVGKGTQGLGKTGAEVAPPPLWIPSPALCAAGDDGEGSHWRCLGAASEMMRYVQAVCGACRIAAHQPPPVIPGDRGGREGYPGLGEGRLPRASLDPLPGAARRRG